MGTIITLTTDFGLADPWVGIMKGAILSINPSLTLVDLTHGIPPQDIRCAAFYLGNITDVFPPGTIHVAVVDPGVGSNRDAIIIKTERYYYVGPNNGVFSLLDSEPEKIVKIRNDELTGPKLSVTFHGRDIFAPVAAHLATTPIEEFGPPETDLVKLPFPAPAKDGDGSIRGEIIHFDRFGNAFTNIPKEMILKSENAGDRVVISVKNKIIKGLSFYYQATGIDKLGAIINSFNLLEFFTPNGDAKAKFNLKIGDGVTVRFKPGTPSPAADGKNASLQT